MTKFDDMRNCNLEIRRLELDRGFWMRQLVNPEHPAIKERALHQLARIEADLKDVNLKLKKIKEGE